MNNYLQEQINKYKTRIPGCVVFLGRSDTKIPNSMEVQLHHSKYLHEKVIFISIITEETPHVAQDNKFFLKEIFTDIYSIKASFGFREVPDLNKIITWAQNKNIIAKTEEISFFFSRGLPVSAKSSYLSGLSEKLYIFLAKNALPAYEFFKVKDDDVVELGVRYKV